MDRDKNKTVAFSGYRPEKFNFNLKNNEPQFEALLCNLRAKISRAAQAGNTDFLCGLEAGFALVGAEVFMSLQAQGGDFGKIRLSAVLPFEDHPVPEDWQDARRLAIEKASEVIILEKTFKKGVYSKLNRYLVDNSGQLICYFEGKPGGTANTVRYAEKQGLKIINLPG
jgi:uncharacterized phage-like protein YoqJ